MPNSYNKATLIGGHFQDPSGNALASGYLTWMLNHDSNISTLGGPTGTQVTAGVTVRCYLDTTGNVAGVFQLWTNDVLSPQNSYYTVRAYNSSGIEVWQFPQIFSLVYSDTIDLGTLQPILP